MAHPAGQQALPALPVPQDQLGQLAQLGLVRPAQQDPQVPLVAQPGQLVHLALQVLPDQQGLKVLRVLRAQLDLQEPLAQMAQPGQPVLGLQDLLEVLEFRAQLVLRALLMAQLARLDQQAVKGLPGQLDRPDQLVPLELRLLLRVQRVQQAPQDQLVRLELRLLLRALPAQRDRLAQTQTLPLSILLTL